MDRWLVGLLCCCVIACGDDVPGETAGTTEASTGSSESGTMSPSSSSASASSSQSGSDSSTTDATDASSGSSGGSDATSLETLTDTSSGSTEGDTTTSSSSGTTVELTGTDTDPGSTSLITETSVTTDPDTGVVDPQPNGSLCEENAECISGFCFLQGILGGICGECLIDADCMWGCGVANPLADPPEGSTCDDGTLGAGCNSDVACMDPLVCTEVVNIPGVITFSGCSECEFDADCPELCSPNYDTVFTEFEGHWACVDAGSQPLGAGCDFEGTGDDACSSGHCAAADVMGFVQLGICSECDDDGDCGGGGSCIPPIVEIAGDITPGVCE